MRGRKRWEEPEALRDEGEAGRGALRHPGCSAEMEKGRQGQTCTRVAEGGPRGGAHGSLRGGARGHRMTVTCFLQSV